MNCLSLSIIKNYKFFSIYFKFKYDKKLKSIKFLNED